MALAFLFAGCVDDPRDPKTWIKKLEDPREQREARINLVRINDPAAVPALISLWQKRKDPEDLKAIAHFKDKRAVPVMIDALDYSEDSFDAAATAATALGDLGDASAVDPLIKALTKPLPIKTRANIVKLEAMKALVKLHDGRAVAPLCKVLETPADEQDFFLNSVAAGSLGDFGDARAVPSLIRGLFMTGRGADIFQPCRVSLLQIGSPAVKPLIEAMQHKDAKLEEDAKKYEFRPGVIEHKIALILGDLRAKDAVPVLTATLKKPAVGESHRGALYALGMIAEPASTGAITAVLGDAKADQKERVSAAEALNLSGDPAALPALLNAAKTAYITEDGQKYDNVRVAAALAYGRVGGAAEAATFAPVASAEKSAKDVFDEVKQRLEVAKLCSKDIACYAKALDDAVLAKQEKAAFMLARLGKQALPHLVKKLTTKEPIVRLAVLFGIGKLGDKSCSDCKRALDAQIELDRTKPPMKPIVDEMKAVRAMISGR